MVMEIEPRMAAPTFQAPRSPTSDRALTIVAINDTPYQPEVVRVGCGPFPQQQLGTPNWRQG